MTIKFTKMHGLGNDFIVIDGINQQIHLTRETIKSLSARDTGIGFDQCLLVEKSQNPTVDFFYRIFNADGHEVGQCGNGARCLARFLEHYHLSNKKLITVATRTTLMHLQINPDNTVTVNMGRPNLTPADIPLLFDAEQEAYLIPLDHKKSQSVHAVSVGNPHAVMVVPELTAIQVDSLGRAISEHPLFPEQCNAGFMQIINSKLVKLRVYERGCGETKACGSGAVAAVAIGRLFHQLAPSVRVQLPGGALVIDWPDLDGDIFLTGPATFVYEGVLFNE